jgi:hypothetical protein
MTKRIDQPWAPGSTSGGRLANFASFSQVQTYHVFLLYDPATNTTDLGFDSSVAAVNRPSGWSARRIGSILIDTSGNIIKFFQLGNYFEFDSPVIDLLSVAIAYTPSAALYKLTVPTGLEVTAKISVCTGIVLSGYADMPLTLSIQPTTDNPLVPSSTCFSSSTFLGTIATVGYNQSRGMTVSELSIPTNTNGEIQAQRFGYYAHPDYQTSIQTLGWTDFNLYRGK